MLVPRKEDVTMSTRRVDNRHIYLIQPKFPPSYWGLDYFLPLTPYRRTSRLWAS